MPVAILSAGVPAELIPAEPLRSPRDFVPLAVALAWSAGFIHAAVVPEHFGESFPQGAFFVLAACLQFTWGGFAYRGPRPRVLLAGAFGSCFVAALWLISRTIGALAGLDKWEAEPVGMLDVLATLDELALAGLVVLILRDRYRLTTHRLLMTSILVGLLVTASVFGPTVASHHHG